MARILLVDDSATIRMSLELLLAKSGYSVTTAPDGQDALVKLAAAPPDLIITDFNMPAMNGIEFVKAVRATPQGRFTPILLLTNESDRSKRDLARDAGATGWIVKPVTPEALAEVLRTVLPA